MVVVTVSDSGMIIACGVRGKGAICFRNIFSETILAGLQAIPFNVSALEEYHCF